MDKQYCAFICVIALVKLSSSVFLGGRGGSVRHFAIVSIYPLKGALNYP